MGAADNATGKLPPISAMDNRVVFSDCEQYRYSLARTWGDIGRTINFLMLNPSTANEVANDPTVERCMRRAFSLGYGRMVITNIFALRSTDPRGLRAVNDPVGPWNMETIASWAMQAETVVCAWGVHGKYRGQGDRVLRLLREHDVRPVALRLTKEGIPRHPLYLPYNCGFVEIAERA